MSFAKGSACGVPSGMWANLHRSDSTFEQIPVIDFTNAASSDHTIRQNLADQILNASANVGFFYISNHGIREETITAALDAGKQFFSLPTSTKMELDIHKSPNFKGYTALLGENTNTDNDGDLHEGFDLGWEHESTSEADTPMSGVNVWPDPAILPGFKDSVLAYYHSAVKLGQLLFPLFALALGLPENFFDDKTTKPAAIMRLLHYPPQTKASISADGNIIGIGAHTDYECFTLLWQDDVQALQVQNAGGKWIDAVPIPGTLVLNLGDQFARWTNDVFKSTVHRVVNSSGLERYSVPLFFGTDYDVRLEPIPGCVSADMPAKYDIVTAGEYVKGRLEATYKRSGKT